MISTIILEIWNILLGVLFGILAIVSAVNIYIYIKKYKPKVLNSLKAKSIFPWQYIPLWKFIPYCFNIKKSDGRKLIFYKLTYLISVILFVLLLVYMMWIM